MGNLSRRAIVFGLSSAAGLAGLSSGAAALTTDEAATLVSRMIERINTIINSGRSEAQMVPEFEKVFAEFADVPTIARAALGVAARSASTGQLNAFSLAFRGYISRKYGRRFREFVGGRLEVQDSRAVKSFYEVRATAFLKGSSPFEVVFLVSDKSGRDLFFNMYIEGVNMVSAERAEIGAMLDKRGGDIDKLIVDLKSVG